jgi:ATP-dependent Zn protease
MNTSRPGRVVVVVTVLQGLTPLPEALRRAGRFDRRISLPKFSEAAVGAAFLHEIGMRSIDPSLAASPERVGFVLREEFKDARRRSLLRTALQRRARRTQRKIMFSDLIEFAVHGTGEEDTRNIPADELFRTAVHEAGHVVVSWLDSHDGRAPVYASVTDRSGSLGVVVPPYNAYERISHDSTRRDIDHRIRVCLAGRVAENMMIGRDLVSAAGSARDLECASALAYRMFGEWGLPVSDENSDNLAVFGENVSEAERARVSRLVRGYLSDQFKVVEGLLRCNSALLRTIAHELAEKGVLFQEDIERLKLPDALCA